MITTIIIINIINLLGLNGKKCLATPQEAIRHLLRYLLRFSIAANQCCYP